MSKKKFIANSYTVLLIRLLTIFVLFMLCRFIFFFFNSGYFPASNLSKWLIFIKGGLRFDMVAILYTNSLYILLSILPFRWIYNESYQKVLKYIFLITNGVALSLNCIDFIYYRFTLKRITWDTFSEVSKVDNVSNLFLGFFSTYWYVLFIWITLLILLLWSYNLVKAKNTSSIKGWKYYTLRTILMLFSVAIFIGGVRGGDFRHSTRPITISNAGEYVESPKEMFIVLNTPFCIYRTITKPSYQRISFYKNDTELNAIYSPIHQPDSLKNPFKPMNVVILIVESLSKEAVGGYNKHISNYTGYTPFIDSLMKQSKSILVFYCKWLPFY